MKIAFYSNYLTHHQLPLCLALDRLTGGNFTFVAAEPVPDYRRQLGYEDMHASWPFVLRSYENPESREQALQLARDCDMAICGSASIAYANLRAGKGLLTFRYSERLYKRGPIQLLSPKSALKHLRYHGLYRKSPVYMLCASAYTASDFGLSGAYRGRTYKWGYFPPVKAHDPEQLLGEKAGKDLPLILWAGRLIDWKHPELAVELAKQLRDAGCAFRMEIIGTGDMAQSVKDLCDSYGLEDCVSLPGAMSPEEVCRRMELADIFLSTSDKNEGWGAVLNESMNAGCAVVASHAVGSVPFLLRDGENGLIFRSCDGQMLYEKVKALLDDPERRQNMGREACRTMESLWNADEAAARLLQLSENLLTGGDPFPYADGPCSRAPILSDRWRAGRKQ